MRASLKYGVLVVSVAITGAFIGCRDRSATMPQQEGTTPEEARNGQRPGTATPPGESELTRQEFSAELERLDKELETVKANLEKHNDIVKEQYRDTLAQLETQLDGLRNKVSNTSEEAWISARNEVEETLDNVERTLRTLKDKVG